MVFYLGEPLNDPPPKPEPGSERRQHKRRFIHFAVRYRFNAEGVLADWKTSDVGNISAGGLFMTFGETLEKGKQIQVEFVVPGHEEKVIKATGTIRWTKEVVQVDEPNEREQVVRELASQRAPVRWIQVTRNAGHVYFSHRAHVTLAGMPCADCHGDVAAWEAPPTAPNEALLSMDACMACHREQGASTECATCHQ